MEKSSENSSSSPNQRPKNPFIFIIQVLFSEGGFSLFVVLPIVLIYFLLRSF